MSIQDRIHNRIKGKGRGVVFTPKDFLDLGSRAAVDQSLSRMTKSGTIRRLGRGVYDFPKTHPRLGNLTPSSHAIAKAVTGKGLVQISGARAANILGLSTQVPARDVFLGDTARNVRVGKRKIQVRLSSPRSLIGAGTEVGTVYQALRHVGRSHVDDRVINVLRRRVPLAVRQALHTEVMQNRHLVADWLAAVTKTLATAA